jgi:DNA-binding transcriptional LysR family regulator
MSVSPPLRKLQYVLAVARELHFRKAAERLNVSQPSMSRQIRDFEAEIGFDIFHRDHHLVAITEPGRAFIAAVDDMMKRLDTDFKRASDSARIISKRNSNSFTIGHSAFIPGSLRREIRTVQRRKFASLKLQFRTVFASELVDAIDRGLIQAGVTFAPLAKNNLQLIPFRTERLCAVALGGPSPGAKQTLNLADLRSRPLVATCSDRTHPALYRWLLQQCAIAGFKPTIVEEVNSAQEAFDLVQDGIGIAILPEGACENKVPALRCFPIVGIEPLQLVFVYRREGDQNTRKIVSEIAESLQRTSLVHTA